MKALKFLVVLAMVMAAGCASSQGHLPKHALTDPADMVSIPHPVEIEKTGIKFITTFQCVMDLGLWVEVVNAGGVWPFLAMTPDGKILNGYNYMSGINYWGDFMLQFISHYSREELNGSKILYFNRDAGFAYHLNGKQVPYNPKKFENDNEYRKKFFNEFGTTLSELNSFWIEYFENKGLDPPSDLSSVLEIRIGSPEWEGFKKKTAKVMKYNYKMADGQIRAGFLPLEQFRLMATEIPGFNGSQRFIKRAKVPLFALPFTGAGMLIMAGANIVGDAVAAGVNDDWTSSYARAKTIRYKMAPLFRQICRIYKELLEKRDRKIKDLEFELMFNYSQIGKRR